jgi:hypothetical protein
MYRLFGLFSFVKNLFFISNSPCGAATESCKIRSTKQKDQTSECHDSLAAWQAYSRFVGA